MSETKHTPGPWTLIAPKGQPPYVENGGRMAVIVEVKGYQDEGNPGRFSPIPKEENEANARLIASAPDLLEALRPLAKIEECYHGHTLGISATNEDHEGECVEARCILRARAAIAKAEGR